MIKNILEECRTLCDLRPCGSSGNPLPAFRDNVSVFKGQESKEKNVMQLQLL
jgi:hypothetical protein